MATHRFKPRYRGVAYGSIGFGGAVAVVSSIAGFVMLPFTFGVIGVGLYEEDELQRRRVRVEENYLREGARAFGN